MVDEGKLETIVAAMKCAVARLRRDLVATDPLITRLETSIAELCVWRQESQERMESMQRALADRNARLLAALGEPRTRSAFPQASDRSIPAAASTSLGIAKNVDENQYRRIIEGVRSMVVKAVPAGSRVAVLSKGDPELLRFEGRQGWHFPQQKDGTYAGHHPKDGAAAIQDLERIRAKGAEFLVLPATAMWWLEYYREFSAHLLKHGREIARDDQSCTIFQLQVKRAEPLAKRSNDPINGLRRQVQELIDSLLPRGSRIIVFRSGNPALADWDGQLAGDVQGGNGESSRFKPLDADEAITLLEEFRRSGAEFLIVPRTASEWLRRHRGFGLYLERNCRLITDQMYVCTIFELRAGQSVQRTGRS